MLSVLCWTWRSARRGEPGDLYAHRRLLTFVVERRAIAPSGAR